MIMVWVRGVRAGGSLRVDAGVARDEALGERSRESRVGLRKSRVHDVVICWFSNRRWPVFEQGASVFLHSGVVCWGSWILGDEQGARLDDFFDVSFEWCGGSFGCAWVGRCQRQVDGRRCLADSRVL